MFKFSQVSLWLVSNQRREISIPKGKAGDLCLAARGQLEASPSPHQPVRVWSMTRGLWKKLWGGLGTHTSEAMHQCSHCLVICL